MALAAWALLLSVGIVVSAMSVAVLLVMVVVAACTSSVHVITRVGNGLAQWLMLMGWVSPCV